MEAAVGQERIHHVDLLHCLPCKVFNEKCKTVTLVVTCAGCWLGSALDMAFLCLGAPEPQPQVRLVHMQLSVCSVNLVFPV